MASNDTSSAYEQHDENLWAKLYRSLPPVVRFWVYNSGILAWKGQEADVAWDIVLNAVSKTFETLQNSTEPVASPESFCFRIARNHFIDCVRHEKHLTIQTFSQLTDAGTEENWSGDQTVLEHLVDPSEDVFELVYEDQVLVQAVCHISRFPRRQRYAILNDLANQMLFEREPTVLQQAFLERGICVQEYQRPFPLNQTERGSLAASRSLAYKRLSALDFDDFCDDEPLSK